MKKYFFVFRLASQELFQYKFDFLLNTLKYSLMVLLMSIVWINVGKTGHSAIYTQQDTVMYFIWSAILYSISNFHPWYIEEDIKLGYLSKYLVKPISPTLYYLFYELARVVIVTILKLVVFISILITINLLPKLSLFSLLSLFAYGFFIFIFSFYWLSLISILSFWITEAYAVRWAVTSMTRLLSGLLVPILFFPQTLQKVFFFLPFEHIAFTPIQFILGKINSTTFFEGFGVLLVWIIILFFVRQSVWNTGIRDFEGTGL